VVLTWQTQAFRFLAEPLREALGEQTAAPFAKLRIYTVGDLLRHIPRGYLKGTELTELSTLKEGEQVAITARVLAVERRESRGNSKAPGRLEVTVTDGRGRLQLTFFGKDHLLTWWEGQLGLGVSGLFVGKVRRFRDQLQMSHPEFVMLDERGQIVGYSAQKDRMAALVQGGLVGLYPASAKLHTWKVAECARILLDTFPADDPFPQWVREQAQVVDEASAMGFVHRPNTLEQASAGAERLRFDEAFATQLTMAYRREDAANHQAVPVSPRPDGLLAAFDARLPFELTPGQQEVGQAVFADMARSRPMQRLLQGEVGSGKTVVALRAMLAMVDGGAQAALLAPTEVLATQHYRTITGLLGGLSAPGLLSDGPGTEVTLLTGSMSAVSKRNAMLRMASGEAGIVVGTHALLSGNVGFAQLGLVVIDEQHRFGVEQRAAIADKAGTRPHTLVLTATPIPRSVAMTVFGDLEVSTLTEVPAGRSRVSTVLVDARSHPAWVERTWERVREEVAKGRQVFVVCPRIGQTGQSGKGGSGSGAGEDAGTGRGAAELYQELRAGALAELRLGLLHGQLPTDEKDAVMSAFTAGKLDVLVATTVIEVGVDVPNASMMVVWDAERFGISQLHQLRGRIGRGAHPGLCLLVTEADLEEGARRRLESVAAISDGFELAELDLAARKEGDVLGASQSGTRSTLRLLRVLDHADIIERAREIALEAVARDPECQTPGFADAVQATQLLTEPDWLERG
jgi:ATP-dependent DNA helicase RecG